MGRVGLELLATEADDAGCWWNDETDVRGLGLGRGLGLSMSMSMDDLESGRDELSASASDIESSPVPVPVCIVEATGLVGRETSMINGSPTKQHRVLISSMTAGVMTSSGGRVACGMDEPTTPIGGVYRACLRMRARMCALRRAPARGELRIHEKSGREPYNCVNRY